MIWNIETDVLFEVNEELLFFTFCSCSLAISWFSLMISFILWSTCLYLLLLLATYTLSSKSCSSTISILFSIIHTSSFRGEYIWLLICEGKSSSIQGKLLSYPRVYLYGWWKFGFFSNNRTLLPNWNSYLISSLTTTAGSLIEDAIEELIRISSLLLWLLLIMKESGWAATEDPNTDFITYFG
jgi:hypothetical protein